VEAGKSGNGNGIFCLFAVFTELQICGNKTYFFEDFLYPSICQDTDQVTIPMESQKSRSLMAKNIGLQLGLSSDHCTEQLIAGSVQLIAVPYGFPLLKMNCRIEKTPGGSKILQVLSSLSKASAATRPMLVSQSASKNLKVAVAAATHKLDIPERPITADIHRRQLQEEVIYASFSNAVQKILQARCKEAESKLMKEGILGSSRKRMSRGREFFERFTFFHIVFWAISFQRNSTISFSITFTQ
jgi:hypothetical protein